MTGSEHFNPYDEEPLVGLLQEGFFKDAKLFEENYVSKDGKIDIGKLMTLWVSCKGRKYKMKYILTHGEPLPAHFGPWYFGDPDKDDEFYRECLETGKTWQERLNCKPDPDNILI